LEKSRDFKILGDFRIFKTTIFSDSGADHANIAVSPWPRWKLRLNGRDLFLFSGVIASTFLRLLSAPAGGSDSGNCPKNIPIVRKERPPSLEIPKYKSSLGNPTLTVASFPFV
jgi:hypothetical protein